jgi:hypothetical protein
MAMLELMLLIAAIFGAGFVSGFSVRAFLSRRRRKLAREQDTASFTSQFTSQVTDAPLVSPGIPEIPIAAGQSKPHRTTATAPRQQTR